MLELKNSLTQQIRDESLDKRGIELFIKRDDLIHDEVSGNKWRKLKYNIETCRSRKLAGILTFGGAYSNHLIATAAACQRENFKSVGIVRGDELSIESNSTLKRCHELGMKLIFISRVEFELRNEKFYTEELLAKHGELLLVPEGGANYMGIVGCQEMMIEIQEEMTHIFVSQGTSTTSCGIALGLQNHQMLNVVPALKGYKSLQEMKNLLLNCQFENGLVEETLKKVKVFDQYHFGGYGKCDDELIKFIQEFFRSHHVKLDPIYTGKTMFAIFSEIEKGHYDDSKILFIHTGGIQGSLSIEKKEKISLYS